VRRADNLTTFMCRLSTNLGASTSWTPQGLSRPVMGLLYLLRSRYPLSSPIPIVHIQFTAISLHFHIVPAITMALTISCVELFYPLSISVRVLCYQPSCNNCLHLAIFFKFVAAKISLQGWRQTITARPQIPLIHSLFSYEIIRRANLFPDHLSYNCKWPRKSYNIKFNLKML
jgi:hypothetical protein